MYLVKYYNRKLLRPEYRRYVNYDEYQVRKMSFNYSKRHDLIIVSITKEH